MHPDCPLTHASRLLSIHTSKPSAFLGFILVKSSILQMLCTLTVPFQALLSRHKQNQYMLQSNQDYRNPCIADTHTCYYHYYYYINKTIHTQPHQPLVITIQDTVTTFLQTTRCPALHPPSQSKRLARDIIGTKKQMYIEINKVMNIVYGLASFTSHLQNYIVEWNRKTTSNISCLEIEPS